MGGVFLDVLGEVVAGLKAVVHAILPGHGIGHVIDDAVHGHIGGLAVLAVELLELLQGQVDGIGLEGIFHGVLDFLGRFLGLFHSARYLFLDFLYRFLGFLNDFLHGVLGAFDCILHAVCHFLLGGVSRVLCRCVGHDGGICGVGLGGGGGGAANQEDGGDHQQPQQQQFFVFHNETNLSCVIGSNYFLPVRVFA